MTHQQEIDALVDSLGTADASYNTLLEILMKNREHLKSCQESNLRSIELFNKQNELIETQRRFIDRLIKEGKNHL